MSASVGPDMPSVNPRSRISSAVQRSHHLMAETLGGTAVLVQSLLEREDDEVEFMLGVSAIWTISTISTISVWVTQAIVCLSLLEPCLTLPAASRSDLLEGNTLCLASLCCTYVGRKVVANKTMPAH